MVKNVILGITGTFNVRAFRAYAPLACAALICAHTPPAHATQKDRVSFAVGTGFYVTHAGHLLTANHVVENCTGPISVHSRMTVLKAKLIAQDRKHDLALIKVLPNFTFPHISKFRPLTKPVRAGEPVIVTGYPSESMNGEFVEFLTGDAKVTYTKSHIGDDSQFMFSYAAKSGYSGGPVLDKAGNVLGMTASATCISKSCMDGFKKTFTMKASTVEEAEALENTIAQHVDTNIATSLPVIIRFLDKNDIPFEESNAIGSPTTQRIREIAQSVANIRCPSAEKTLVENTGVVKVSPGQ